MSDGKSAAAAPEGDGATLALETVTRSFLQGGVRLEVLRGVSLAVRPGEMVALVGPSGAGKSTLLHIAGLLEQADGGAVRIAGRDVRTLADAARTAVRRHNIGFVYQYHHLLPEFSAEENLVLPQMIAGVARSRARARARDLLERVGLGGRLGHRPAQLSGGEQQRVAIGRALANAPGLLLADEPTGNLDQHTAEAVFTMLQALVREQGLAALVATHNLELSQRMDRVLRLSAGAVVAA